jgi:transketolase
VRIITPTDNAMGIAAADYSLTNAGPAYFRFDKYAEGEIYPKDHKIDFDKGFEILRDGCDIAVASCGSFTSRALRLAEQWRKNGIEAKIIDLFSLPFNAEHLLSAIGNMPVLTVEEHILSGGIGSMVLENMHENGLSNPFRRIGISFDSGFPQTSGSREYFFEKYGLADHSITSAVNALSNAYRMNASMREKAMGRAPQSA